jgi:tRNA pseudouridine13 synthase
VIAALRKKRDGAKAMRAVDKRMMRLYVSAFQSDVFNEVLSQRIDSIDRLLPGDIAKKTDSGGIFQVEDPTAEQDRADRFEISPTGPLPGNRCRMATGEAGLIESSVMKRRDIDGQQFEKVRSLKITGTRRALRFKLLEPSISAGADDDGEFLEVRFTAPPGSYATVAIGEITKSGK